METPVIRATKGIKFITNDANGKLLESQKLAQIKERMIKVEVSEMDDSLSPRQQISADIAVSYGQSL